MDISTSGQENLAGPEPRDLHWTVWKVLLLVDLALSAVLFFLLLSFSGLHAADSSGTKFVILQFPIGAGVPIALSTYLANRKKLRIAIVLMSIALPLSIVYLYLMAKLRYG